MLADILERDPGGKVVAHELFGRVGHDDLAPVRCGGHASRTVHRGAEVVALSEVGLASVDADADEQRVGQGPLPGVQLVLGVDRRRNCVMRGAERCVQTVTCGLDDDPAPLLWE